MTVIDTPPAADRSTDSRYRQYIFDQIDEERERQVAVWGEQHHPDGTGPRVPMAFGIAFMAEHARLAKLACNRAAAGGTLTWMDILREEFFEGMAESDWQRLRAELVQIAAVCVAWIEDGDNRD
jgi:hypothetical protein